MVGLRLFLLGLEGSSYHTADQMSQSVKSDIVPIDWSGAWIHVR